MDGHTKPATLKRRSRMRRTSSGKRIELSPRDYEIFRLLRRYRYLRSTYIHAFVGGASATRFKERLGQLFHEGGYLNRSPQQWESANARSVPVVYENTLRAEQALAELAPLADEAHTWLSGGARRQFSHAVMICEILASIELATLCDPDLRFVPWQEILAKAPEERRARSDPFRLPAVPAEASAGAEIAAGTASLIPDALFGLEYRHDGQRRYRFFALEADRATMPVRRTDARQSSFARKILSYLAIMNRGDHRRHLGIPNLLVLNVTTSERHMRTILALLGEVTQGKGSAAMLFKVMRESDTTRPSPNLLAEPWERAVHGPLRIDH